MTPTEIAEHLSRLDWSATSSTHQLAVSAAAESLREPTNIVRLPVRPRTCWTTLCHLDGRRWASSSGFGPEGAWSWIVDTVAHEHGVTDDQIGGLEDLDGIYDHDDLVTVDGLPVYRVQHFAK